MKIYDGGSMYSDLVISITGNYSNKKISIPGNQMYIEFETISTVSKGGFKASIYKNGIKVFG